MQVFLMATFNARNVGLMIANYTTAAVDIYHNTESPDPIKPDRETIDSIATCRYLSYVRLSRVFWEPDRQA